MGDFGSKLVAKFVLNVSNLFFSEVAYLGGKVGHSRTRGTVVFFYLFRKLKTFNFEISMVIYHGWRRVF